MFRAMAKLFVFSVSLALIGVVPAKALALVDQGNNTYDPNTGLQWLDVSLTTGHSFNDVTANYLASGDLYDGYRYATSAELSQLLSDAGITPGAIINSEPAYSIAAPLYNSLITSLGSTNSTSFETIGLLADIDPMFGDYHVEGKILSTSNVLWSTLFFDSQQNSVAGSTDGSFLVRDAATTPLPAALPLLATGICALGLIGRRRKRKASSLRTVR